MFEPTTQEKAQTMLDMPMVEWSDYQHGMHRETKEEIVEHLDALIVKAARLRGYLDMRVHSRDHDHGVQNSNTLAMKIRRILGYTQPRHDVSF